MSESKYTGQLCYESCVIMQAHWLLNGISTVWYESDFFQDSLEELKLVVRGSLLQVASLQDCFLQQSEPLATTSTGVGSGQFANFDQYRQTPRPLNGLGPIMERWAVSRVVLQDVSTEISPLCQSPGQGIFSLHFSIFITLKNLN